MPATTMGQDLGALAAAGTLAQNAEASKGTWPANPEKWVAEVKWDGWRILAVVRDGEVCLYSRSGKTYNGKLPHIEAELANFPDGTILDGEAVAVEVTPDGDVIDKWHTVQTALSSAAATAVAPQVSYAVFDLIAHGGLDARPLAFSQRRELLEQIFATNDFEALVLTVQIPPTPEAYELVCAKGFEGAVLKRLDAPYASGKRGAGWTKVKTAKTGFTGMVGAVLFGQYDEHGNLVERGKVSGFPMATRKSMTANPEKWLGVVIEVSHEGVGIGATDSGRFRFPRWKRVRNDRKAESVGWHDA
jgi:ATP-dependent DNA ligase